MKTRISGRAVALALAILMLLPLISIPTFAADPTVYWAADPDNYEASVTSGPATWGTTLDAYEGNYIGFYLEGQANPSTYPNDYYVVYNKKAYVINDMAMSTMYPSSGSPYQTMGGSFTVNGTAYTFTEQKNIDNGKAIATTPNLSGVYICSPNSVDAMIGFNNVAKPIKLSNAAVAYNQNANRVAFETQIWVLENSVATMAGRVKTSGGNVELYGLQAKDNKVYVKAHENAETTGAAITPVELPTEQWFTLTAVVDTTTGVRDIFVNGKYAFSTQNMSHVSLTGGFSITASSWELMQINRGNYNVPTLSGGIRFKNMKIYNGAALQAPKPDKSAANDFEDYPQNTILAPEHGFNAAYNSELAPFTQIVTEGDNNFLRLPIVYDSNAAATAPTNMDKTIMPNHVAYQPSDEYMVIESSFRPHGGVGTEAETIELQIRAFQFSLKVADGGRDNGVLVTSDTVKSGNYLNLFTFNLNTGAISNSYGMETTGAEGIKVEQWNHIKYVLNLKESSANLYVNGELYAHIPTLNPQYYISSTRKWATCTNASDLQIPANSLIIAKANKKAGAFVSISSINGDYTKANYVDIDNIKVDCQTRNEIDGNFDPELYKGLLTTEELSSVRLGAPSGLRFATRVDKDKLDTLYNLIGTSLVKLEMGTLIIPADYGVDATHDALDASGKVYLDVKATYGKFYSDFDEDPDTTHFVGSIVNIKDANLDRNFVGTGYVRVTLNSGLTYVYYAQGYSSNVQATAGKVIADVDLSGWTNSSKLILDAYANKKSLSDLYADGLEGLDVLALGDSLFSGNDTTLGLDGSVVYDRTSQWVNMMGQKYNWNLTNLGIGGMTVSYQEDVNYLTKGKKASMYHWLMNDINEYHWNVQDTTLLLDAANTNKYLTYTDGAGTEFKYNTYFQTGNFEGKTNEDLDLIILEGGCNDYGSEIAAPLGTVGSTDGSTFIGAYNAIAQKLMEMYPNAKIVFITTWYLNPQSRPDNVTSLEYSTSVNRLYNEFYADNDRVYLIDAGDPAVSGIHMLDADFRANYSISAGDSYHLNNEGMKIMESHMSPIFWEYWINNQAPLPIELSIPRVLDSADDTPVIVKGTVTLINEGWNSSYNNMSVTISDDKDNKLYIYRLATQVELGDIITVTGNVSTFGGNKQIAQGATAEITGHVEIVLEYPEMSLPDATAATDNTLVTIKGQVTTVNSGWDATNSRMNVTISDTEGNTFYIYRLATQVALGDFITVKGTVSSYQGSKQLAAGATAEITGHEDIVNDATATLVFDDTNNRTAFSTTQQIWKQNGITFTHDKDSSSNNIADYVSPIRCYQNSKVTIAYTGMKKIEINCDPSKPITAMANVVIEGATIEVSGNTVIITFAAPTDSVTITMPAQIRMNSIDIYA